MRKGDLSKFIEEAVRWRLLDETAQRIKARNKGKPPRGIATRVEEAVTGGTYETRSTRSALTNAARCASSWTPMS